MDVAVLLGLQRDADHRRARRHGALDTALPARKHGEVDARITTDAGSTRTAALLACAVGLSWSRNFIFNHNVKRCTGWQPEDWFPSFHGLDFGE